MKQWEYSGSVNKCLILEFFNNVLSGISENIEQLGLKGRNDKTIGFEPESQYYWHSDANPSLTIQERIRRRVQLHQLSVAHGYPQPRVKNELLTILEMSKLVKSQ